MTRSPDYPITRFSPPTPKRPAASLSLARRLWRWIFCASLSAPRQLPTPDCYCDRARVPGLAHHVLRLARISGAHQTNDEKHEARSQNLTLELPVLRSDAAPARQRAQRFRTELVEPWKAPGDIEECGDSGKKPFSHRATGGDGTLGIRFSKRSSR